MKILPNYKEGHLAQCSASISLQQNMNALTPEDAKIIFDYMESCVVIMQFLSNVQDPISGRFSIPSRTWSDGVYIWESNHSHYVRDYRVRLPKDFVDHVKKRVATGFDVKSLNRDALRPEVESTLEKLLRKDESCWDTSFEFIVK
jgi:hypothetical protein